MLYISKIVISNGLMEEIEVPCLYYNSLTRMRYTIEIDIRDTKRPGISRLTNAPHIIRLNSDTRSQEAFERSLRERNPYGYVKDIRSSSDIMDALLVAVDKPSLDFLEYVDGVVPVTRPVESGLEKHLHDLEHDFMFWDEYRSIADVNRHADHDLGFPLFQTLCFAKLDWYGNRLFVRAHPSDKCIWYEIKFSDVTKARSMFSKAVLQGYDPISDNLEVLNRI